MFDNNKNKILIDKIRDDRTNLNNSQNNSHDKKFQSHNDYLYKSWKYHENNQTNQIEFNWHKQNKFQIDSSVNVLVAISIENQASFWKIQHHIKRS